MGLNQLSLLLLLHTNIYISTATHPTLVPVVLVTRVLPTWRTWKVVGALMSYQSFLAKGSVRIEVQNARRVMRQTSPHGDVGAATYSERTRYTAQSPSSFSQLQ